MPRTTYGVLKAIRSHQISSPSVAAQLATGRPNACNLCHLDKPLAWTADHLAQWYRQSTPQLSIEDRAVSDAVRLALAGDAGQRALLAWHFGWEPALQTSGRSWITPVLAQLLDDPYAAVRCIAQRSLRRVSTVPLTDYDFSVTPSNRPSLRSSILELWAKTTQLEPNQPLSGPTQVQIGDPVATQQAFDKLALERNNRPVRLRE